MAKRKPAPSASDIELKRWCVEMAIRWPCFEDRTPYHGATVFTQHGGKLTREDADVIGRAKKIREWVKSGQ